MKNGRINDAINQRREPWPRDQLIRSNRAELRRRSADDVTQPTSQTILDPNRCNVNTSQTQSGGGVSTTCCRWTAEVDHRVERHARRIAGYMTTYRRLQYIIMSTSVATVWCA
ncbi:hypothetical protein J6590_019702 [Homalodisca vitripennis]|nr:hypothetical protein J6590_019702 [Homalodisca vitripennis]